MAPEMIRWPVFVRTTVQNKVNRNLCKLSQYYKGRVKHTKITLSNKITLVLPHRRSGDPQCFLLFCIVLESYRAHCTMSFLVGVLSCLQFYSTYIVVYIHTYIHAFMHSCIHVIRAYILYTHAHTYTLIDTCIHPDILIVWFSVLFLNRFSRNP